MEVSIEDGGGELRRLVTDLGKAPRQVLDGAEKVLERGALNVKNDLNEQASGSRHFHGMAGSVSYDRSWSLGGLSFEVGPDKGRRGGALGNLFFFGGANGGGGTGDLDGALSREAPKLESAMGQIFRGLL